MSKNYAVVTICDGPVYEKMAELTHPTIKAYADKVNADFINLSALKNEPSPHWRKFKLYDLLLQYKRIIFLDSDLIVRPDCPNLFAEVPETHIGLFNEGAFSQRKDSMMEAVTAYKEDLEPWDGTYYNTGVMVVSRCHRKLFKAPDKMIQAGMYEQPYLNLRILKDKYDVKDIRYRFNRMTLMDSLTGENRLSSYIVHYAGAAGAAPLEELLGVITEDLAEWSKAAPAYDFKQTLLITVNGGLGDQVCIEPVIRFVNEVVYPNARIIVKTHFPRLFRHLTNDVEVYEHQEPIPIKSGTAVYKMDALPGTDQLIWKYMSHTLVHTTDFSSLSCVRRTLPPEAKQIKLDVSLKDILELTSVVGTLDLSELILVHPGFGWPSKTFPTAWWQEVIDGLAAKTNSVALIGKALSAEQGYLPVKCPTNVLDLRDKLSLDALIALISAAHCVVSNDSAPIHIAGAFDNWIVAIPTCKRPEHILPWRKGSQEYKTRAIYKKLTIDAIDSSPTQVYGQTIDYVIGNILDYLPEPSSVVDTVLLGLG